MHVHVSAVSAFVAFLSVLIFGFFWRLVSMKLAGNKLGEAMAFLY